MLIIFIDALLLSLKKILHLLKLHTERSRPTDASIESWNCINHRVHVAAKDKRQLGKGCEHQHHGQWFLINVGPFDVVCVLTKKTAVRPLRRCHFVWVVSSHTSTVQETLLHSSQLIRVSVGIGRYNTFLERRSGIGCPDRSFPWLDSPVPDEWENKKSHGHYYHHSLFSSHTNAMASFVSRRCMTLAVEIAS
jgi:hypothetical protein